ncbi:MAG: 3-isopropylmalate dehydratase small subunit [Candidatus Omnitrophica bacterium 4484_70.1]|nr:MAG: 3-isopropylmalate dehydratase small subunit [Candidatus Omnitrophica bacterium 4484_70.1]
MIIKGRVHKLGDNINTDEIIAAKYLDSQDSKYLGAHCMETIDPDFVKKVKEGDILVGGSNFGCGSSREHAPLSIKGCGISLVIAKSFARIFYRNAINIGLPILVCKDVDRIEEGEWLEVDLSQGEIKNVNKKETYPCEKFPPFMQEIINSGGLINWMKREDRR